MFLVKTCTVNSASPLILHESKEFAKQNLRAKVTKFKIDVSYLSKSYSIIFFFYQFIKVKT